MQEQKKTASENIQVEITTCECGRESFGGLCEDCYESKNDKTDRDEYAGFCVLYF